MGRIEDLHDAVVQNEEQGVPELAFGAALLMGHATYLGNIAKRSLTMAVDSSGWRRGPSGCT